MLEDSSEYSGDKKSGGHKSSFYSTMKAVMAAKENMNKVGTNNAKELMQSNAHIQSKLGKGLNTLVKSRAKG